MLVLTGGEIAPNKFYTYCKALQRTLSRLREVLICADKSLFF
jgi:hypothetical protein